MAIVFERELNGGEQIVHRFENGLGASVIRHGFSYGASQGLWELAVITFTGEDTYELNYETPITNDVIGYLDDEDVQELLDRIEALVWEE